MSTFDVDILLFLSLEVDPSGDLQNILVGEGAVWVEVVAACPLQSPHQAAHVRCKAVLRGSPCQAAAPATRCCAT